MCIWVSWKNGRTRAANLMKLGVPEHEAYTHGMSSKGPWVLSSSQAVHQALSTALLEEWGLPSLLAIWTKLTAKESNRLVRTRMLWWCGRGPGATRAPIPIDCSAADRDSQAGSPAASGSTATSPGTPAKSLTLRVSNSRPNTSAVAATRASPSDIFRD